MLQICSLIKDISGTMVPSLAWEDPGHNDKHTGSCGDNDPTDVCETGSRCVHEGKLSVKVLGIPGDD